MKPAGRRRERILQMLRQKQFATVSDLAETLACSRMTIRRDLDHLESAGLLERSHGAAAISRRITLEFAMGDKVDVSRVEKDAIGRAAARLVAPGQRIILDTGTTTLALARALRTCGSIIVVTTSLTVVSTLLGANSIECMLLGGTVRKSSPDLYGPLLEENLSRMHPDWAFIGCDGLSVDGGLTTGDARVARATALMVAGASRVALLVDSSKAANDSFMKFAELSDLDVLITDDAMPGEILDAARAADVQTIIVHPTEGD